MSEINKATEQNDEIEIVDEKHNKKQPKKSFDFKKNTPLIILVLSVAIFSLVAGSVCTRYFGSLNKISTLTSRFNGNYDSTDTPINQRQNSNGMMGGQNRGGMGYLNSSDDSSVNRISGVVVSVDNKSFKIAGNGKSYTVYTTNSTTYNNTSKSVSVNDSVMVSGTLSDTTMTATTVRVINM